MKNINKQTTPADVVIDCAPVWRDLSAQQLKQAGLNISGSQRRKIDKSLSRLSTALASAGLQWTLNADTDQALADDSASKQAFDTYLASHR